MVTSRDCMRKYGDPEVYERQHMTIWTIPQELRIKAIPARIYCNRDMVEPFRQGLYNVVERGHADEILTWDGCFNIRKKRGLRSLSLHSWGIAFDINYAWNKLGDVPTLSEGLVHCFTDAGFDWGGYWVTRPDGMHFQLKKI